MGCTEMMLIRLLLFVVISWGCVALAAIAVMHAL